MEFDDKFLFVIKPLFIKYAKWEGAFKKSNLAPKNPLIKANELGETSLMFLVHPSLQKKEIQKTCDVIEDVMKLASI